MKIPKIRGNFVDTLRLYLRGGPGGAGHPKYGGVGGQGGSIYLEAKPGYDLKTLKMAEPSKRYLAGPGMASQQFNLFGKNGTDIVLHAPPGTECQTDACTPIGEVNVEGDRVLMARGGDGGNPTNGFLGQQGEHVHMRLVLKTIADVGLLGFPNAGKSTLLRAISRAKPKVASYPFTTLKPIVGSLLYPDDRRISMADLPGLVEGAAHNRGLGHSFLRHIERTRFILVVVDVNGFQLKPSDPRRSALESVLLLNKELEMYDPRLLSKPAMLLLNKMDVAGAQECYDEVVQALRSDSELLSSLPESMRPKQLLSLHEVVGISAKTNHKSVQHVKDRLRLLMDLLDEERQEGEGVLVPIHSKGDWVSDVDMTKEKLKERGLKLV